MKFPLTREFLAGRQREHLSNADLANIENMIESVDEHNDAECIAECGAPLDRCHLLLEGFVFRTIEAGGRRLIVGINIPGDFIDLHGLALNRLDHSLVSAGTVRLGAVPHSRLRTVMSDRPAIAHTLWIATLLDAAIQRKWTQILGQLDAPQRIVHIYAELQSRLELIGRKASRVLRTPFTQPDLGGMCGVSAIHANRAVAKLRDLGVCEIRRGDIYTDDWQELRRYASFDDSYLYGSSASEGLSVAEPTHDFTSTKLAAKVEDKEVCEASRSMEHSQSPEGANNELELRR